jgi:hypothetical protein
MKTHETELVDALSEDDAVPQLLDQNQIAEDIAAGAKAIGSLLRHAGDDWSEWSKAILGLRGLKLLAFQKAGVSDITSGHYKNALTDLLKLKKYAIYDQLGKQVRSSMYKLMDNIEQIDGWYSALPAEDKLRWKHPDSVVKHAPRHLVTGGKGDNKPKPKKKKKPATTVETERLRSALVDTIQTLTPYDADAAARHMANIMPAETKADFDDVIDFAGEAGEDEDEDKDGAAVSAADMAVAVAAKAAMVADEIKAAAGADRGSLQEKVKTLEAEVARLKSEQPPVTDATVTKLQARVAELEQALSAIMAFLDVSGITLPENMVAKDVLNSLKPKRSRKHKSDGASPEAEASV